MVFLRPLSNVGFSFSIIGRNSRRKEAFAKAKATVVIMILYADVYIIINALCDWLALWSCGAILSLKFNHLRLLGGTFFLAGYSLAAAVVGHGGITGTLIDAVALAVGCLIAYEVVSFKQLLQIVSVFFLSCLMTGGVAGWLFGLTHRRLIIVICLTPTIYFAWLYVSEANYRKARIKKIKVRINGNVLSGMVDSGNLLVEEQSGLSVIIINKSAIESFLPTGNMKIATAVGTDFLPYFIPNEIQVGKKKVRAAVAVNERNELEYDCIVPMCLAD